MIESVSFSADGFSHYMYWQTQDKRTLKKINKLINDIIRNGNTGVGHPEPLRHDLSGKWSREIDEQNRLVYKMLDDSRVEIYHYKGHYGDS